MPTRAFVFLRILLMQIAATLSVAEDVNISAALREDRREIRARLISAQKAVLEQTEDVQCILDLVQDVFILLVCLEFNPDIIFRFWIIARRTMATTRHLTGSS